MEQKKNKCLKVVALSLVVILLMSIVSSVVKTNHGNTLIRKVDISTRGGTLSGMMYIPKDALVQDEELNYTDKRPAVILSHGYLNSNQMQDPNAIELSRRGYVVFSMDMYGHGNSDLEDDSTLAGNTFGAIDAYNYVLTLPYVDTTRIGFVGHSMGGMNTGNALAQLAGFYTVEDELLNMLHDELNVEISAEDVKEQNPDEIAAALDEYEQGIYEVRKQEIETEYAVKPKGIVFMGSGPNFAYLIQAHQVEVAGNTVWRNVQANVGVAIGIYEENAWTMFGTNQDGFNDSADIPKSTLAKNLYGTGDETVERDVWYQVGLSGTEEPVMSTVVGGFDETDPMDTALQEGVAANSMRVITQPAETHMMNHFSRVTTGFIIDFYNAVLGYNCGEISEGAEILSSGSQVWLVKEYANGIALAAMFIMIIPLLTMVMESSFFSSLKKEPLKAFASKKDPWLWVIMIAVSIMPGITYIPFFKLGGAPTTWAGNTSFVSWGLFTSQEMSNRLAMWSVLNAVIILVVLLLRYRVSVKKTGITFGQYTGLATDVRSVGKAFLLGLIGFAAAYATVLLSSFFFDYSDMRMWVIAGRVMTKEQFIAWGFYFIYFLIYYIIAGAFVNTGHMADMSERKNTLLCSLMNGSGMILFVLSNYIYLVAGGHLLCNDFGQDYFLAIAVCFPTMVTLPLSAYFSRKLYEKTNSVIPGAILNAMIFTWIVVGNTCFHYSLIG